MAIHGQAWRFALSAPQIDNAITLQMGPGEHQVYGYMHFPCRVEVNSRLVTETTVG